MTPPNALIEDLHSRLPEKIRTEIGDRVQFFIRSHADQQMRMVISLSQQLEFERLKRAFRLAIYIEPIFSYVYREDNNKAYWQKQKDIDSSLLVDLVEDPADTDAEVSRFLTMTVSPFEFPIVKARVIRKGEKDILCINMNHTPTDGAGIKEFAALLASVYNQLSVNPDWAGTANLQGDRSISQVTGRFTIIQKLRFVRQGLKKPPYIPIWSFGWNKSISDDQKQLVTARIPPSAFLKIKAFGKQNQATVNDVMLTAFVRAFEASNPGNENTAKPFIVPVDLRKYIRPGHHTAICSLTGSMVCRLGKDIGKSFAETLIKVRNEMNRKKQIHAEMNMLASVWFLSGILSYSKLKKLMMERKMPPVPLVTNVGIIDPSCVDFGDIPVDYAYIAGAVLYGDYFCMGYSTFKDEITLSIGFTGSASQVMKARTFLDKIKDEIETIPG